MDEDLKEYIQSNYGYCDRYADCYHGQDSKGYPPSSIPIILPVYATN